MIIRCGGVGNPDSSVRLPGTAQPSLFFACEPGTLQILSDLKKAE
jgi:hypothetical protein